MARRRLRIRHLGPRDRPRFCAIIAVEVTSRVICMLLRSGCKYARERGSSLFRRRESPEQKGEGRGNRIIHSTRDCARNGVPSSKAGSLRRLLETPRCRVNERAISADLGNDPPRNRTRIPMALSSDDGASSRAARLELFRAYPGKTGSDLREETLSKAVHKSRNLAKWISVECRFTRARRIDDSYQRLSSLLPRLSLFRSSVLSFVVDS